MESSGWRTFSNTCVAVGWAPKLVPQPPVALPSLGPLGPWLGSRSVTIAAPAPLSGLWRLPSCAHPLASSHIAAVPFAFASFCVLCCVQWLAAGTLIAGPAGGRRPRRACTVLPCLHTFFLSLCAMLLYQSIHLGRCPALFPFLKRLQHGLQAQRPHVAAWRLPSLLGGGGGGGAAPLWGGGGGPRGGAPPPPPPVPCYRFMACTPYCERLGPD
jgi:hypothetical protein